MVWRFSGGGLLILFCVFLSSFLESSDLFVFLGGLASVPTASSPGGGPFHEISQIQMKYPTKRLCGFSLRTLRTKPDPPIPISHLEWELIVLSLFGPFCLDLWFKRAFHLDSG